MRLRGATNFLHEMRASSDEGGGVHCILCRVQIMARANSIAGPFQSEMRLRAHEGQWRIFEIRSLTAHIDWTLGGQGSGQNFLKY